PARRLDRLTPSCLASPRSGGSRWPGLSWPLSIRRRRCASTCSVASGSAGVPPCARDGAGGITLSAAGVDSFRKKTSTPIREMSREKRGLAASSPTGWTTCDSLDFSWSLVLGPWSSVRPAELHRSERRDERVDDGERDQVRRCSHEKDGDVAAGCLQHVADHLRDQHAPDGAGHPAQTDDGSNRIAREHVGDEREDVRR